MVSCCSKGPTQSPITMAKPSTYYEGGPKFDKGWYLIERTISYICPHCNGNPESIPSEEPEYIPEVKEMIQEATGELSIKPKPINADWQDW